MRALTANLRLRDQTADAYPVGRPRRVRAARVISVVAVVAGIPYLWSRYSGVSGSGVAAYMFFAAECVAWMQLTLTTVLLGRAVWRSQPPPPPDGPAADVLVTVCGEPLSMVERTVQAALAIRYPHKTYVVNDGRRAGLADWAEVDQLARRLGVECLTRRDGPAGKAGNLNSALRRTSGEFVLTIDADHVAHPDFLDDTLGWFTDSGVAFVATPQAFQVDADDPFNNAERFFYDFLQPAKDRDSAAFSCGNGSVYRRCALAHIGGFSEWNLVEDLHTSYCLHAAGWRSVYHPRPLTVGSAPAISAVYLKQRMRWAIDSVRLLVFDSPIRKPGLTLAQRIQYVHTTSFYLFAAMLNIFLLAPVMMGLFGAEFSRPGESVNGSLVGIYLAGVAGFLWAHAGRGGLSQILQGHFFAAPVYLLAAACALLGRHPDSAPTEKRRMRSSSRLVLLPAVVFAGLVATIVTVLSSGPLTPADLGNLAWATLFALLLVGPLTTTSPDARTARVIRRAARAGVLVVLGVSVLAFGG